MVSHQRELQGYVLPLVGCLSATQDVVQETALALWEEFERYDSSRPFSAWAKGIARNKALMCLRNRRHFVFLNDELIEKIAVEVDEQESIVDVRRSALLHCLTKLTDDDRQLIRKRYGASSSIQQFAQEASRESKAIYRRLALIRRRLHECVSRTVALGETS